MSNLPVGCIVKYSEYALRSTRDRMVEYVKGSSERSSREREYRKRADVRGVIVGVLSPTKQNPNAAGYSVRWDGGTESKMLDYMVEKV